METRTLILGAGAAGLFCGARAGPGVLVIDHARAPGEKIRISGGGRCNFTNLECGPHAFLGRNPHFCKSALSRYTQWDFVDLVTQHGIAWHEKTLGQLFCDGSSRQIVEMLRNGLDRAGARLWLQTSVAELRHDGDRFHARLIRDGREVHVTARHVVLATGGKSVPGMGATDLAHRLARQFGLAVTETRPALVPLTFPNRAFAQLAGVSTPVRASAAGASFEEALLFSHRGLSGPAILQVSSFWHEGLPLHVDLLPAQDVAGQLRRARRTAGKRRVSTWLAARLPQRLVDRLAADMGLARRLGDLSETEIDALEQGLKSWTLVPGGTEGYRTAEVTLGGIDTDGLSSRTMESRTVEGLFAIGEAVDVTGWLGGYNFQWAWSSADAAGQAIASRPG